MPEVRFSLQAEQDLDGIIDYTLSGFGQRQADSDVSLLRQAAETAAHFPGLGRVYTTSDGSSFQRYNAGRHSLFYRMDGDDIVVFRILHRMMDFDRHLR